MITDQDMIRLHTLELKIAGEIRRICEKEHISYFLTAGTTLGAVRHGGFIPWDEDMDLGMLREEYERFLSACQRELGEEFELQTWDTHPGYPFAFAKVRLKDTCIEEAFCREADFSHGIFVDIFPFDSAPDRPFLRKVQGLRYFLLIRLLWIKKHCGTNLKDQSPKQRLRYGLFRLLSLLLPYGWLKERFRRVMVRYNRQTTQCLVAPGSYAYQKEMIPRKWTQELTLLPFEEDAFPTYEAWDAYLTHMYGDYRKLPPEEQRHKHDVGFIDFGPYQNEPFSED